jgi:hypothetical protein
MYNFRKIMSMLMKHDEERRKLEEHWKLCSSVAQMAEPHMKKKEDLNLLGKTTHASTN